MNKSFVLVRNTENCWRWWVDTFPPVRLSKYTAESISDSLRLISTAKEPAWLNSPGLSLSNQRGSDDWNSILRSLFSITKDKGMKKVTNEWNFDIFTNLSVKDLIFTHKLKMIHQYFKSSKYFFYGTNVENYWKKEIFWWWKLLTIFKRCLKLAKDCFYSCRNHRWNRFLKYIKKYISRYIL